MQLHAVSIQVSCWEMVEMHGEGSTDFFSLRIQIFNRTERGRDFLLPLMEKSDGKQTVCVSLCSFPLENLDCLFLI